jgi:hypothetical protein
MKSASTLPDVRSAGNGHETEDVSESKPVRRRYTHEDKLRILRLVDACRTIATVDAPGFHWTTIRTRFRWLNIRGWDTMVEYRYQLFADYRQFYLQDEQADGDLSDSWTQRKVVLWYDAKARTQTRARVLKQRVP